MKAGLAGGLLLLLAAGALGLWYANGHQEGGLHPYHVPAVARPFPYDPATGLEPFAARSVPTEARCPVCGMYPARYPRWAAQLIFKDGGVLFFDSPLELFRFLQDMGHYHATQGPEEVARAYVSDAEEGRWVSIVEAYFVSGSDLQGPMRTPDLPAFADEAAAAAFVAARGGRLIRLEQVTPDLLQSLGYPGHGHP